MISTTAQRSSKSAQPSLLFARTLACLTGERAREETADNDCETYLQRSGKYFVDVGRSHVANDETTQGQEDRFDEVEAKRCRHAVTMVYDSRGSQISKKWRIRCFWICKIGDCLEVVSVLVRAYHSLDGMHFAVVSIQNFRDALSIAFDF